MSDLFSEKRQKQPLPAGQRLFCVSGGKSGSGQTLKDRHDVLVVHLDDAPGKIVQAVFFGDMPEGQPLGAEGLGVEPRGGVHFAVAVFDVAQHRVAEIGKVRPDLVCAPGDKPDPAQGEGAFLTDHRHVGDDLLVAVAGPRMDADLVVLLVMLQPGDVPPRGRCADRDRQVFLFHKVFLDDTVQIPQGRVGLGRQDQPFRPAVQAVADRGGKAVFSMGIVFAFLLQIEREGVHQIGVAGAVAVAQQVRRFVQRRDVAVLIDHGHGRLAARRFGLGRCGVRREKLVVDIQFDQIAGGKAGVRLGALPVHFDALVAEGFVHQTARHLAGHALDKPAQAHAVFVGARGKTFHKILSCFGIDPLQIALYHI